MNEELPIVGKTYYCYDDGKITYSRQYKVKITDITPYKKASDEDKNYLEYAQRIILSFLLRPLIS